MKLSARDRRYLRKHGTPAPRDASELSDELNIVPYLDVVVNLIMFLLMVISSAAFFTQLDTSLSVLDETPTVGPASPAPAVTVMLADRGIIVASRDGVMASGCEQTRRGASAISVPRRGASYDWPALTSCAAQLKQRFPSSSRVTLTADPRVPYQDLMSAMDALRDAGGDALFPDVLLSAGTR